MSSLAIDSTADDVLYDIAQSLLETKVHDIVPVRGGGNNRVYRVDTRNGSFALKFYPLQQEDPRDRQGMEVRALRFLERYNVWAAPRVIVEDREQSCAVLEWIDGERIHGPSDDDIDSALRLLAELRVLSIADGADYLALASAATLSGLDVVRQIESRLARIREVSNNELKLAVFLREELVPAIEHFENLARKTYAANGQSFDAQTLVSQRT